MKKQFRKLILCLWAVLPVTALAQWQSYDFTDDNGLTWLCQINGGKLQSMTIKNIPAEFKRKVVFPTSVTVNGTTYNLTKISSNVILQPNIYNPTGLLGADMVIPGSITEIDGQPLGGTCMNSITFAPNSVLTKISGRAFINSRYLKYIDMTAVTTGSTIQFAAPISHGTPGNTFYRLPMNALIYLPNGYPASNISMVDQYGNEVVNFIVDGTCRHFKVFDENVTGSFASGLQHGVYVPHQFTAQKVSYTRKFTNKSGMAVSTLYLPYSTDLPDGMQAYKLVRKGVDADGKKAFAFAAIPTGTRLAANTPYLVRITDGQEHELPVMTNVVVPKTPTTSTALVGVSDTDWAFDGTTEGIDNATAAAKGAYNLKSNQWHRITTATTGGNVAPFRCFVSSPTSASLAKSFALVLEDETTSIDEIRRDEADVKSGKYTIYDLSGKNMGTQYDTLPAGNIYIVNGKKFYKM